MDTFIMFTIFCYVFLVAKAVEPNNPLPEIRYPFGLHCSRPGFELFSRQNRTFIHIPTYGDLIVKSIFYDTRKLDLIDPKNCVPEVFLNLNLSLTPFSYYYDLKGYRYINCSSQLSTSFVRVPCLSGSNHHVYVVETSFCPPVSCSCVGTLKIPFSYSPYLSDNSFGLSLTRNLTGEFDDAGRGIFGIRDDKVLGLVGFIFLVVTLFYAKRAIYKAFDLVKENKRLGEIEVGKVLGEYEPLNPAPMSQSNMKVVIH